MTNNKVEINNSNNNLEEKENSNNVSNNERGKADNYIDKGRNKNTYSNYDRNTIRITLFSLWTALVIGLKIFFLRNIKRNIIKYKIEL